MPNFGAIKVVIRKLNWQTVVDVATTMLNVLCVGIIYWSSTS